MKNIKITKNTVLLSLLNIVGVFVYLCVASKSWNASAALTNRAFFDDIFLRPFWYAFFILNGLWLILIIRDILRFKKWISLVIWLLIGMLSYGAFQYERYHFLNIVKETEEYENSK
jgi:hypothetical protein